MEALLGFGEDAVAKGDHERPSSSDNFKLVPWMSWDEWEFVRESLFSSSADKVASALKRISTWRMRGCIPAAVDVTASIIEIQQKDGFIRREKQPVDALYSEHLLQMLYCMSILRLVNCVIEKTRKKTSVSIAEAAEAIGIPRMLIDLRHEGSHRELPSLLVLQDSADKALDWLKSYYWEPQKLKIPFRKDGTTNVSREIESRLRELASCLNVEKSPQLGYSPSKGKRSKKYTKKTLKTLKQLYSSFPSEVVSILLEFLLKALDSSNYVELPKEYEAGQNPENLLDEWRLVITKLSNEEPEVLLNLLQAILDMVGSHKHMENETEGHLLSEYKTGASQVQHLSYLFLWLVGHIKGLKHSYQNGSLKINVMNAIPIEFLRKCLLLSACGNNQLMDSAIQLSELMGVHHFKEELRKLALLRLPSDYVAEEDSSITMAKTLVQQEESIQEAAQKLEWVKLERMKTKGIKRKHIDMGNSKRWVKLETWNPCPIGMLPALMGSSGQFPALDSDDIPEKGFEVTIEDWELRQCGEKREASCDTQELDNSSLKKMRESVEHCDLDGEDCLPVEDIGRDTQLLDGLCPKTIRKTRNLVEKCEPDSENGPSMEGFLMMGGGWKKVGKEELLAIGSAVKIWV